MKIRSREDWSRMLFLPFYQEAYLQTMWNTPDPIRREGWILVSGRKSPWYFNMRPMGDSPELFFNCCCAMADLLSEHDDVDLIAAIEMAGINFSGGMAIASRHILNIPRRIAYTRAVPQGKIHTPEDAAILFARFDQGVANYGDKHFLEGRLQPGDRVGIFDDMATNLGSKEVARLLILWVARQQKIPISCRKIFYLLNRERTNRQRGLDYAKQTDPGLYPEPLYVDYLVEFDEYFPSLAKVMHPAEFATIKAYQENPGQFQDPDVWQREVVELAAKTRQG